MKVRQSQTTSRDLRGEREVRSLSDFIEQYIKDLLNSTVEKAVEIQRNELAERFRCVPSQINYVLETRFTAERGYIVRSRRGGGGYIRINRIEFDCAQHLREILENHIADGIEQEKAEHCIQRLKESGTITAREARALKAAVQRDVLGLNPPERDALRARLLKAMIVSILARDD